MLRNSRPRILNPVREARPTNFFYRLATSQRFLAVIGLVFLVAVMLPLARTYSQKRLVEKEISEVKEQIKQYESDNQQLSELLEYLKSDQSLEEQARLNLNLKKPGEAVVVIENKNAAASAAASAAPEKRGGNLAKWWRYFFD